MPSLPMTKSSAQGLLNQYGSQIEAVATDEIINNIIARLEVQAKELEGIAENAYLTLGCKFGTLEQMEAELNERLVSLQKETFNLNGAALQEGLLKEFYEANVFKYDKQKDYEEFLRYIETQLSTGVQANLQNIASLAVGELLQISGNFKLDTSGKTTGMVRNNKGKFVTKFSEVFSELGGKLTETFDNYFNKHKDEIKKAQTQSNTTYNGFNIKAQWEELPVESYLKMTNYNNKEERKRFFQNYPLLKKEILKKYEQKIIDSCPGVSRKDFLREAIEEVMFATDSIGRDVDAFFGLTGANLIGRLGEIQSLYYLKVLTGGNIGGFSDWIGGKGNPHADELLTSIWGTFGIQVKNTTAGMGDLQVDFQGFNISKSGNKNKITAVMDNRNIPSLLQYTNTNEATKALQAASGELFGAKGVLPGKYDLIEAIQTVLGMQTFNIEYLWHNDKTKPRFYPHSNSDFADVRAQIEALAQKANQLMSLMAAATMYMQTGLYTYGNANTIYIVGGTTIISAASILKQIATEVRANVDYLASSYKMSVGGGTTIVDVLNNSKKISSINFALQSSYTFTKR